MGGYRKKKMVREEMQEESNKERMGKRKGVEGREEEWEIKTEEECN